MIRTILRRIKLYVIFWRRIVFVKNKYKVSLLKKIRANFFGGYLADQHVLYDFDNNSRKDYLSEYDWYRSRNINHPYNTMLNNKIICNDLLKHFIIVPEIFYVKTKDNLVSMFDSDNSFGAVFTKLKKMKNLYMKPINAGKGKNVRLLSYRNNKYFIDESEVLYDEVLYLLQSQKNWFLSEKIEQANHLNNIYDKTTNTIRIIVIKDNDINSFIPFFAVQRIGTKATIPVDNGSRGGLVSNIDLNTGKLSEARTLHSLDVFERHPDSYAQIKGVVIPNWKCIEKEIIDLSNNFLYLNFIAWDVLITESGPAIIEANTSSGVNIIQLWGGQRNRELGDFYRKHNIIN